MQTRMDDYSSYFGGGSALQPDVLITPIRNIYPGARGATLATIGAASSPDSYTPNAGARDMRGAAAATTGGAVVGRNGLAWWTGLVLLVVAMLFAARKSGNADEFKNLRASAYNVIFITLVAMLGFTVLKVAAVRAQGIKPLEGLADVILAA